MNFIGDGWMENHLLPDTMSKLDTQCAIIESNKKRAHQILPRLDRILDEQLFTKLTAFYGSCMNEDVIERRGIQPLYDLFHQVRRFLPLSYYASNEPLFTTSDSSMVQGLSQAVSYLGQHHIWALFEMQIGPDPEIPSVPSITLWQGEVGLPSREYYDDTDVFSTYMQVVTEILEIVFSKDNGQFGWKSSSPVATARRILEFEKKLAQVTYRSDTDKIQRWTLQELHQAAPNLNWTLYVESMLPHGSPLPDHILVPVPQFVRDLSDEVLRGTNVRTLQMYLIWRTIWKYLDTLGEEFVAPKRKLEAKLGGIESRAKPPRWETCLNHVDRSLGFLLGRYFVIDQLDPDSKERADDVMVRIMNTFVDRLDDLDWLQDDATKAQMVKKLRDMDRQVGYPISQPDLRSTISVAEYYSEVIIDETDFMANVMSANQWKVKRMWNQLRHPVDRDLWKMNPQNVYATYDSMLNKVVLPAGALQQPLFDARGPGYLNYGALGSMIGHELLHGFDQEGRRFDSRGIAGHWWSNETMARFDSRATCFVQQYSKFEIQGPHGETYQVDGKRTLANNLADNGGIQLAYSAWEKQMNESDGKHGEKVLLPGLGHWTPEQLFYINFGRTRCRKSTPEHDVRELRTKTTSPNRFRVNGPLMNSPHFAKTFKCAAGTPMNPHHKCILWA
ncbi:uncharacterized protein BYT42DRAFT_582291 [Radiomyces spectabilis]|uniref:uncharacterized protein n=1 Tax=Radiomyces spectabilis TaxID=64574 RepID=UPI00221EF741|nr:uncharacterized protein BYT42DRAFT_582291 [Radiomyces spectabilis]KAI8370411.1 hypothetical protein BYT42DRAFT_582291 [Radiomyces spectabilis]